MALSAPKKITTRDGRFNQYGVKSGVTIYGGAMAMLASGYLRAARVGQGVDAAAQAVDAALCQVVGYVEENIVGGAADGTVKASVRTGVLIVKNYGTDPVTIADIGKDVYVFDDETIARTSATNTRPKAGKLINLDGDGAHVRVGPGV